MFRTLTFATLLSATVAVPAVAQDRDTAPYDRAGRLADEWADPARLDAVGDTVEAVTRALLAMPVGPLADAAARMDPDSDLADVPPDATLADLAGEDEDMPARLADDARHAGRVMAGMTQEMARMLPVFEAMAHDMAAQWRNRIEEARRDDR